jgi:hypothetical protein
MQVYGTDGGKTGNEMFLQKWQNRVDRKTQVVYTDNVLHEAILSIRNGDFHKEA